MKLFAILLAAATTATAAFGQTWQPELEFSHSTNPLGVWSYGYTDTLGGEFHAHQEYSDDGFFYTWRTSISLGTPSVFVNHGGEWFGQPVGSIFIHPGPAQEGVLRWTAPEGITGLNISADFLAGDQGGTDHHVLLNGSSLFSALDQSGDTSFTYTLTGLTTGDTLDFVVGRGSDGYTFDTTPVRIKLEAVPEPATLAVLGLGALCLRRRRKSN